MAIIYEIKERRVIPNWRDFRRTLQVGELSAANKSIEPISINISRSIDDWKEQKNIGTAADLLNSAFISGITDKEEIQEAIKHVLENKDKSSQSLIQIIKLLNCKTSIDIQEEKKTILEIDVDTVQEFQAFINNKALHKVINKTKKRTQNEIYNPIIWVELARLYAMHGQTVKAERAILTALHLAPNNRFVVRSATRFFIHTEQSDKALFYLKNSQNIKNDPWLISAHIATSSAAGRFSTYIKDGIKLIDSGNFSDYELTELTSSIGTLEFKDGSFKKAKRLFEKSMISPNDNSLAQLEWISKSDNRFSVNPFSYKNVINPFEAYALDYFQNGNWQDAFYNCIKWFLDMPFSKRPILLGSYIASSLLNDKNSSIILCEVGLQANPHDPTLLNNLIYALLTSGNIEKSNLYINQLKEINLSNLPNEGKITIQATLGLAALRNNEIETGKKLYEAAIQNSEKIKNDYLKNLAVANYTKELVLHNLPGKEDYIHILKNIKINPSHKDIIAVYQEVLELIKNKNL